MGVKESGYQMKDSVGGVLIKVDTEMKKTKECKLANEHVLLLITFMAANCEALIEPDTDKSFVELLKIHVGEFDVLDKLKEDILNSKEDKNSEKKKIDETRKGDV